MPGLEKNLMLKEVKAKIKDRKNIFITRFSQVNVPSLNQFRQSLAASAKNAFVVKNSIIRIIFKDMGLEKAIDKIDGNVLLVTADENPQDVSKQLVAFAKEKEAAQFEIRGAYIEGDFRDQAFVKQLATLPPRNVLIAITLGTMKAPITNFVCGLSGVMRSLVIALHEVNKKKEHV